MSGIIKYDGDYVSVFSGVVHPGQPYLCIPVDGEGGAREFLNRVEDMAEQCGSLNLLRDTREIQALLPEEAP